MQKIPNSIKSMVASQIPKPLDTTLLATLTNPPDIQDPEIRSIVEDQISVLYSATMQTINNAIDEALETRKKYIDDAKTTLQIIEAALYLTIERKQPLEFSVKAEYPATQCVGRTLDEWKKFNPVKWQIIEHYLQQLRKKGWEPIASLNKSTIDDEGYRAYYSGGDILTVTCYIVMG